MWRAHHYDDRPFGREDCPDDETPIAGAQARLALSGGSFGLDELGGCAVDGEVALARVLGEMVDVGQLKGRRSWLGTSDRSVEETIVQRCSIDSAVSASQLRYLRAMRYRGTMIAPEELVYRLKRARPGQITE